MLTVPYKVHKVRYVYALSVPVLAFKGVSQTKDSSSRYLVFLYLAAVLQH